MTDSQDRSLRVLLVIDSEDDAELLLRHLRGTGYQIASRRLATPADLRDAISEDEWDVALCDYELPAFGSKHLLSLIEQAELDIPVIVLSHRLSGTVDEQRAAEMIAAGAADYVFSDQLTRLDAIVMRELKHMSLRDERRRTEAQRRAAQRMEAVGRLAGGIAHDFNNLLTAILTFSSFVKESLAADDPSHEDLDEVLRAGRRAADLTAQLLAFSRRRTVAPRVIALREVLDDMHRMLQRILGEDVELETRVADDLWSIEIDPSALEQVVVNLAVNARDAMPRGGKLTIEAVNANLTAAYGDEHGALVAPGDYVMLAVSDNGSGMDPDTQRHIFEPFYTTKAEGKGTGLGLSTCYGIVKQADGFIWCYSEPGVGTTFKVYLPRTQSVADEHRSEPPVTLRGSELILVVEDDPSVRKLALRALERQGYRVIVASSGEEALSLVAADRQPLDMLLTDVVMSGMGGKHLADRLGELRPDLKVLFMSGYTANAIAHHGVLEPGLAFIQKPFAPEDLALRVREVLDADGHRARPVPSRARVLLVDDSPAVLRSMARQLRQSYEVASADSGAAALELLGRNVYDLVLCDVAMPEMSGVQLHDRVCREQPDTAERFVFMTSLVGELLDEFLADGDHTVLRKPVTPKDVNMLVARLAKLSP